MKNDTAFKEIKWTKLEDVRTIGEIQAYLEGITRDPLRKQLTGDDITQKRLPKASE